MSPENEPGSQAMRSALIGVLSVGVCLAAIAAVVPEASDEVERELPAGMAAPRTESVSGPTPIPLFPNRVELPWLQVLVNDAAPGSVLKLKPGVYSGPVVINKPLTLDGGGQVTVDGGGKGTVMTLEADGAALRGMRLTGSGGSHDSDDACLNVRGHNNTIEHLEIDDCLFGIDLKQSNENRIRFNRIRSKVADLGVRGDGLRLWYSMNNLVHGNQIVDSRDMVAWYSHGNVFSGNTGARSRYSIHFMFANGNVIENNRFYDNAVGVYLMYTESAVVRGNTFSHANGPTGMGVGFKEASNAVIENNEFIYCAHGTYSDLSPFQPDSTITIRNNRFAYNGIAMYFASELAGYVVENNRFDGNMSNVALAGGGSVQRNAWKGNTWDDYEGFDRNHDGIGDRPYELYDFADRLWMEIPYARFFRNAPMMEAIDFLERLAPFSSPTMLLRDVAPRMKRSPPRPS